ncbi:hypothetical protein CDL12_23244 [Handroanthus impetiginosus]|uniref:Uncharacterized protein n=1 Tax=Handroanthus impetiginosus TaxID=429701 RepID=A0A2G9GG25_9LAMI|nr:hypothetical protein CDL12_23244 [Handroanthus impetiginosus]
MALKTWKNMLKFPHLVTLILLALLVALLHLTRNNDNLVLVQHQVFLKREQNGTRNDSKIPECNFFSGKWVYDNISYPLYKERNCSFMENDFACERHGRKDLKYQNWRWQPHHCDLPRFNGTALLEKLRGKKLVFVGDSLIRNQWRSMLCLIEPYLTPSTNKTVVLNGTSFYSFHSIEYNATIGLYWAPMLVESNCDDVIIHRVRPRVIRIKSIAEHGRHWNDADILVFDSYAWWMDRTMTVLWGSFGSPDAIYKRVEMKLRRYEIVLNTWSDWLEMHLNRTKTKVFFMSASPFPSGHTMWGTSSSCLKKTDPIFNETYWASGANRNMMRIVESTIEKLAQRGLKVEYLNITQLSGYREDAHPAIYRTYWHTVTKQQLQEYPAVFADCMHWCLPGVPDIWNQILYAYVTRY